MPLSDTHFKINFEIEVNGIMIFTTRNNIFYVFGKLLGMKTLQYKIEEQEKKMKYCSLF